MSTKYKSSILGIVLITLILFVFNKPIYTFYLDWKYDIPTFKNPLLLESNAVDDYLDTAVEKLVISDNPEQAKILEDNVGHNISKLTKELNTNCENSFDNKNICVLANMEVLVLSEQGKIIGYLLFLENPLTNNDLIANVGLPNQIFEATSAQSYTKLLLHKYEPNLMVVFLLDEFTDEEEYLIYSLVLYPTDETTKIAKRLYEFERYKAVNELLLK